MAAPMTTQTVTVRTGERTTALCTLVQKDRLCSSCGTPIWWVRTPAGHFMPVDEPEDADASELVSHFRTCPQASQHSKKGKR
jgi:hypothetical protein